MYLLLKLTCKQSSFLHATLLRLSGKLGASVSKYHTKRSHWIVSQLPHYGLSIPL